MELQPRELFGGAIDISVPARFADVSDFRPLPDSQECFADGGSDQSLIVEIVEHQQHVANATAGQYYFDDVALLNQAEHSKIISMQPLSLADSQGVPLNSYSCLVIGEQAVSKGQQGSQALNKVQIQLCVIRLPEHGSDVLLTLNTPIYISEFSAAAQDAGSGYKDIWMSAPQLFQTIIRTLHIKDYGLFG